MRSLLGGIQKQHRTFLVGWALPTYDQSLKNTEVFLDKLLVLEEKSKTTEN